MIAEAAIITNVAAAICILFMWIGLLSDLTPKEALRIPGGHAHVINNLG
jgi:hypothetical protein